MKQKIFKDIIHGYTAQCEDRQIAWASIRNKCIEEGNEMPTLDQIVEVETKNNKKLVHRCLLKPYGEEEMRCFKCNYITFRDDSKTSEEIIEQMIKMVMTHLIALQ